MRSILLPALVLAALVVSACSSGAAPSAAPSTGPSAAPSTAPGRPAADDLNGRTFIVTGATGHDLVKDTEVTIGFADGRISVHAGCNQMGGGHMLTDGKLDIGPMMTTEMGCAEPLMAQDTWVAAFLPGATVTLDGDTLTLARDGATLTATDKRVVHPDRPLEGTTWVVDGLVTNQAVSSVPSGVIATLVFAGGRVNVNAGCNKGSGTAEVGDTAITFGLIAHTLIACGNDAMAVEAHILQVLQGDVAWTIDSDSLRLVGAGGGLMAKGS
jgi:heat shock protein HslJ